MKDNLSIVKHGLEYLSKRMTDRSDLLILQDCLYRINLMKTLEKSSTQKKIENLNSIMGEKLRASLNG